jgi:hypothetical protein
VPRAVPFLVACPARGVADVSHGTATAVLSTVKLCGAEVAVVTIPLVTAAADTLLSISGGCNLCGVAVAVRIDVAHFLAAAGVANAARGAGVAVLPAKLGRTVVTPPPGPAVLAGTQTSRVLLVRRRFAVSTAVLNITTLSAFRIFDVVVGALATVLIRIKIRRASLAPRSRPLVAALAHALGPGVVGNRHDSRMSRAVSLDGADLAAIGIVTNATRCAGVAVMTAERLRAGLAAVTRKLSVADTATLIVSTSDGEGAALTVIRVCAQLARWETASVTKSAAVTGILVKLLRTSSAVSANPLVHTETLASDTITCKLRRVRVPAAVAAVGALTTRGVVHTSLSTSITVLTSELRRASLADIARPLCAAGAHTPCPVCVRSHAHTAVTAVGRCALLACGSITVVTLRALVAVAAAIPAGTDLASITLVVVTASAEAVLPRCV